MSWFNKSYVKSQARSPIICTMSIRRKQIDSLFVTQSFVTLWYATGGCNNTHSGSHGIQVLVEEQYNYSLPYVMTFERIFSHFSKKSTGALSPLIVSMS